MGACATKPKVLKEEGQAPVPAPEPAASETTMVEYVVPGQAAKSEEQHVPEEKEKENKGVEADDGNHNEADDDQSSKRRSLSHLFKENVGEKGPEETEKALMEIVEQESADTEKPKDPIIEGSATLSNTTEPVPEPSLTQDPVKPEQLADTEKLPESSVKQEQSFTEITADKPEKEELLATEVPVQTEKSVEPVKEEGPFVAEKPAKLVKLEVEERLASENSADVSEIKLPTTERTEILVEPMESIPVVDVAVKVETQKVIEETAPQAATKTRNESSVDKKAEETLKD